MKRLAEMLPAFVKQVEDSLRNSGDVELADQIPLAGFIRWTYDVTEDAGYIYLQPSRSLNIAERAAIKPFYSCTQELEDLPGWVLIDIDNLGRVTGIEFLNRSDIAEALSKEQPPEN